MTVPVTMTASRERLPPAYSTTISGGVEDPEPPRAKPRRTGAGSGSVRLLSRSDTLSDVLVRPVRPDYPATGTGSNLECEYSSRVT